MTTAMTVNFHGADLYLVSHNGEPYAPMRPIVEGIGLNWKGQYTKLKQRFKSSVVEITTQLPGDTQKRAVICLPLRKLAGWLQTISPNKVKPGIRDKVIQYQEECDDVLYQYWTTGIAVNPRKKSIMHRINEACAEYKSDRAIASLFGTGLNEWKSTKAGHQQNIKSLITDAQLLLDLNVNE